MQIGNVTTPFGRRPMTLALVKRQLQSAQVPTGRSVDKWKVFRDACEARAMLGVQDRALAVLDALLTFYPHAELGEEHGLVVFPSNAQLSIRAHGITGTTLRRHLAALVEAGLIIRKDSANGKRYARKDGSGEIENAFGFDLSPLLARAGPGLRFLELGRSCVLPPYRNKPTVELLWHGIMHYVTTHNLDVMFGCASFEGTDPDKLALPLSYLYHHHLTPPEWYVRALADRYVEMNRIPKAQINPREALRGLPPMIKGYLRAGCYIGDGAVVDEQFGTPDVLILFPVSQISERYMSKWETKFGTPRAG